MQDFAHIADFINVYRTTEQICIFTGAGVSYTQDADYRAPEWRQLLKEILIELLGSSKNQEAETIFNQLVSTKSDLWDLATAVKAYSQQENDFPEALRKVVLKENESADAYGRLKIRNLKGATTLNATIAFCSKISEFQKHPCFVVNPRVAAVLTANYDPFLEAGATQKHQSYLFKPMRRAASRYRPNQLPVYHIHGYLPFKNMKKDGKKIRKKDLMPTELLVLDRESYEQAYQPGSWTMSVLERFLKQYTTLFIGFSFNDKYFLRELNRLSKIPHAPVHYALLCEEDDRPDGLLDSIRKANVRPIMYEKHAQIKELMAGCYLSAFHTNEIFIPTNGGNRMPMTLGTYWDMLWFDKRWKSGS